MMRTENGTGPIDRARLAAFADGELEPEEAARVVMHLADHPEDQAFVDRIAVERDLLARAFGPIAREPVPERILTAIEGRTAASDRGDAGGGVLAFFLRGPALAAAALAAAAAVVLVVLVGQPRERETSPSVDLVEDIRIGPVAPDSPLAGALAELSSGEQAEIAPDMTLGIAASFADARGRLCREVQLFLGQAARFQQAIACTGGEAWTVEIVVGAAAEPANGEVYAPASGPGSRAIERLLDEIGAGPALSPDEEAAARARGWRP